MGINCFKMEAHRSNFRSLLKLQHPRNSAYRASNWRCKHNGKVSSRDELGINLSRCVDISIHRLNATCQLGGMFFKLAWNKYWKANSRDEL